MRDLGARAGIPAGACGAAAFQVHGGPAPLRELRGVLCRNHGKLSGHHRARIPAGLYDTLVILDLCTRTGRLQTAGREEDLVFVGLVVCGRNRQEGRAGRNADTVYCARALLWARVEVRETRGYGGACARCDQLVSIESVRMHALVHDRVPHSPGHICSPEIRLQLARRQLVRVTPILLGQRPHLHGGSERFAVRLPYIGSLPGHTGLRARCSKPGVRVLHQLHRHSLFACARVVRHHAGRLLFGHLCIQTII